MGLGIRDIDDDSVLVETNKPGKALSGFSLPDTILERAGEVYKEDAENKKISNEKYQGLPESKRPRLSTQKGSRKAGARAPGLLLNPFNRDGHREQLILDIIKKGGSDLVDSYDPKTGKYGLLKESDKLGGGIIDDDITKRLVLQQDQNRRDTPEFKNLTKEQRDAVNTLTRTEDIIKGAKADTKLKDTKEAIRKLDKGGMWLDDYVKYELKGKAATQEQLDTLLTEIDALQPAKIRSSQQQNNNNLTTAENIAASQAKTAVEERTATTNENTLALAQTKAANELTQQTFENADKVAYRNYQAQEADKVRAFNATESAKDRVTQMEIQLLGREDTREQREYDRKRDERQDRQMMIMQMMKGLQQFGAGFSI